MFVFEVIRSVPPVMFVFAPVRSVLPFKAVCPLTIAFAVIVASDVTASVFTVAVLALTVLLDGLIEAKVKIHPLKTQFISDHEFHVEPWFGDPFLV